MFELANPWMLVAIVIPPLMWFLIPRSSLSLPAALKVPFYHAILTLIEKDKKRLASSVNTFLFYSIWALMVLAAAGPRWVGDPIPLTRDGRNIMLVLDLSGSMDLADMEINGQPYTRLAVVKRAAEKFVAERAGDRIGLILFGSKAYLQTPLTFDRQNVLLRIEDATVGLAGNTTSIGDALGLAVKRLQDVTAKSRVIILLTDGANNSGVLAPLKAAELAKDDKIKVYTIGLGSDSSGSLNNSFRDLTPSLDLDEDTLKEIAQMTGGRYFRATDPQTLQAIYNTINNLEKVSQDNVTVRPQQEYYPWPLALALFLLLLWFAKKAGLFTTLQSYLANRRESESW